MNSGNQEGCSLDLYRVKKTITQKMADRMIEAATCKAEQLGICVNLAVVDDGGNLVSFRRMDNAPLLSIEIAINKAYTSVAFGLPTHEWYPLIQNDPPLKEGIVHTSRLVVFGGGYPIQVDGQTIGGIGASGGKTEEDMACCLAALALL